MRAAHKVCDNEKGMTMTTLSRAHLVATPIRHENGVVQIHHVSPGKTESDLAPLYADDTTGTTEVLVLHSDFIDESPVNQEAAAIFTAEYPWATAVDFEKAFFDVYTDEEYATELADPDSQLNKSAKDATLLPSGGVAVFESLSGIHY